MTSISTLTQLCFDFPGEPDRNTGGPPASYDEVGRLHRVVKGAEEWLKLQQDRASGNDLYSLRAYALAPAYEAGAPVDILLIVSSSSDQSMRVLDESPELTFSITVTNLKGEVASPTKYHERYVTKRKASSIRDTHERILSRGREISYVLRVNRLFDMTSEGHYTIVAQRDIASRPDPPIQLMSNELGVQIVPPRFTQGRESPVK